METTDSSEAKDEAFPIDYLTSLGLATRPFGLTPDPAFYFQSRSHREAAEALRSFLREEGGLALVFGDVGTGKTILARHFLASLDRGRFEGILMTNPLMSEAEFLHETAKRAGLDQAVFGRETDETPITLLRNVLDRKRRYVLFLDEAQLLSDRLLQLLTALLSPGTSQSSPLRVVLFGAEEIMTRLLGRDMTEVRRRVTTTPHLTPLAEDEVGAYVSHRLSVAQSRGEVAFSDSVVPLLFAASRGYPRIINAICDHALLLLSAGRRSGKTVDRKLMKVVLEKSDFSSP